VSLAILSVAYPFAPVGRDSVGGAEQVLSQIDEGLCRAGHRSIVIAAAGSEVAGTLLPVPSPRGVLDDDARDRAWRDHRGALAAALRRWPVDLVHLHGLDFDRYLPPAEVPCLATLHLPLAWYRREALLPGHPRLRLHCVSRAQQDGAPAGLAFLPPIPNGVPVGELQARHGKRRFALMLARICPEKGIHVGLQAAHRAGLAMLLGGRVYPYPEHERYFRAAVRPLLDARRRFLGPLGFRRKRRLLTAAQCVVLASLVEETSSLVAMEALACGTPVVASARGAFGEIVEDGRTGFLVQDVGEMAEAMQAASRIDPDACRDAARRRFSSEAMVARYLDCYRSLLRGSPAPAWAAAPS
jgi:glycosyltransferase involved in cell wall biosynthesis